MELCDGSGAGVSTWSEAPSRRYWMLTPGFSGGILWSIAARYREKSAGARTQPCFRPEVLGTLQTACCHGTHFQTYLHVGHGPGLRSVLDIPVFGGPSTWLFLGLCQRLFPDRKKQRIVVSAALCSFRVFVWHRRSCRWCRGHVESHTGTQGEFPLQQLAACSIGSGRRSCQQSREDKCHDSFHRRSDRLS